jgi:hypothetical protein
MTPCFRNSAKGKHYHRQTAASVCLLQTENGNGQLPFVYANGNGKRKIVFLGQQNINGNRRLLFPANVPINVEYH